MIVTLTVRKAQKLARKEAAARSVFAALSAYAGDHDGRFVVFGSFARGDFGPDSDFDVLVAFPIEAQRAARAAAEAICRRYSFVPDVFLADEASDGLMVRVKRDGRVLPARPMRVGSM